MRIVIVGGGIAGMAAAHVLAADGNDIHLVEQAPNLGGLFRTSFEADGLAFDQGTHFAAYSGIDKMDELIDRYPPLSGWKTVKPRLMEASWFAGTMNTASGLLDVRGLGRDVYDRAVASFLRIQPSEAEFGDTPSADETGGADLSHWVQDRYGEVLKSRVYEPVVRKLLGHDLDGLETRAIHPFGLSRIILFEPAMSRLLKHFPFFDRRIGYASSTELPAANYNYYPKAGSIGGWIETLKEGLLERGVTMHLGAGIGSIETAGGCARTVRLSSGEALIADQLVWTVAPALLLKAADGGTPGMLSTAPSFRNVHLYHLVFDGSPRREHHYINCYDPAFSTYRVTLYPNIQADCQDPERSHLTVEVVTSAQDDSDLQQRVIHELVQMDIIAANQQLRWGKRIVLKNALPVLSSVSGVAQDQQIELIKSSFDNVHLCGRASGKHYTTEVLQGVWAVLQDLAPAG